MGADIYVLGETAACAVPFLPVERYLFFRWGNGGSVEKKDLSHRI